MAERKVLNKYYPPDFDPSKLRRFEKKSVRKMCNVRMMLPMSMRCHTCGNYAYIGTKFNMKVETVKDEDYLGIKIYRFYFKCTQCYSEITFRTDPKNHDYIAEWGASRNHEPWKDMLMAEEEYKEMKQNEMKEDAMKSLEHRTYDSKREMDILDALDQVKSLNRRQAQVNYEDMINKVIHKEQEKEIKDMEKDIEQEAHKIYERMKIRRIRDYSDINLNEDEDHKGEKNHEDYDDGLVNGNINENDNYKLLNEKKNSGNFGNKLNKNFSYDFENEENQENGVLIKKTNSKNFNDSNGKNTNTNTNANENNNSDLLNKKRSSEAEENPLLQNQFKIDERFNEQINNTNDIDNFDQEIKKNFNKFNKKKNVFSKIELEESEENSSDDADSIEKDFEKNKEIFNFSGPNTKLKISKDSNRNSTNKDSLSSINLRTKANPKPNDFRNPLPLTKTNINLLNKIPIVNKNSNVVKKPKVSGLSSLISNYSTDDPSE